MPVNARSPYPLKVPGSETRKPKRNYTRSLAAAGLVVVIAGTGVFLLPQAVTLTAREQQFSLIAPMLRTVPAQGEAASFPVSVNPATKSIIKNPEAEAFFQEHTELTASAINVTSVLEWIATLINNTGTYQSLASADGHLVTVLPGNRKEQIVAKLATALGWNAEQQKAFLVAAQQSTGGASEGYFVPGTYVVYNNMTPENVASLFGFQFTKTILAHYSTTTAAVVPVSQALTVASLLEREASGSSDIRVISGIIWNRLFRNMNLQIDATLQYAKGNTKGNWWSTVVPKDKYIKSPYNTYAHAGLPPGPIAEPSIAAVLAALNPVQTSCIYYFHDKNGHFHCSDTYAEHVALLKKYYGQGK